MTDISHIGEQQRSWNCPNCNEELGELNAYCVYCKTYQNITIYNPDKYFIRDIRISHITGDAQTMTPQEELFRDLFNHEKLLVKDMDTLTLRAHREQLAKIAFEARARLTAADDEEKTRKKSTDGKPTGFSRSVNTDETTTNAINTIKERQKKLSGKEKMLANLIELYKKGGASHAEAEKIALSAMGAGTIITRMKDKEAAKEALLDKPKEEEPKPIFNPFEKKTS